MKRFVALVIFLAVLIGISASAKAQNMEPKMRLSFHIQNEEIGAVRDTLNEFAKGHHFSIFDNGATLPPKPDDGRHIFYLILKSEPDHSIEVHVTNVRHTDEMLVGVYEPKSTPQFEKVTSVLEQVIRRSWPDLAPYNGP
ncbi:MAG TPA: hypothetical protein VMH36_23605 [Alphaproteobacteria bacterium]|nr:hypothetical protein [Alphaproteobacteria bacterium]